MPCFKKLFLPFGTQKNCSCNHNLFPFSENTEIFLMTMGTQKHGIPALISFFIPGLGQLIKGQILKGILIWVIGGGLSFFFWWTIIVPLVIWVWNVYDAYNSN